MPGSGSLPWSVKMGAVFCFFLEYSWLGETDYHSQVVEYIAEALLGNYSVDAETQSFVDNYDFYFFPVVNPDG